MATPLRPARRLRRRQGDLRGRGERPPAAPLPRQGKPRQEPLPLRAAADATARRGAGPLGARVRDPGPRRVGAGLQRRVPVGARLTTVTDQVYVRLSRGGVSVSAWIPSGYLRGPLAARWRMSHFPTWFVSWRRLASSPDGRLEAIMSSLIPTFASS